MAEAERAAGSPLGSVQVVRACVCLRGAGRALGGSGALSSGVPGCSGGAAWAVFCIFFFFPFGCVVVWTLNFFFFFNLFGFFFFFFLFCKS